MEILELLELLELLARGTFSVNADQETHYRNNPPASSHLSRCLF